MKLYYVIAAVMLAAPVAAQDADASGRLDLICAGSGSANKQRGATIFGGGDSASILGTRDVGFSDQVALWIEGQNGRLRMPRSMLPRIRGGEDGWFELRDIEWQENEITGTVAVSILNKPKFRVDRYTGAISISGKSGDYAGGCERFDPETQQRAF